MLLWGLVAGALIGFVAAGLESYGALLGAGFGWGMARWLRSELRAEIRAIVEDMREETAQLSAPLAVPQPKPADLRAEDRPRTPGTEPGAGSDADMQPAAPVQFRPAAETYRREALPLEPEESREPFLAFNPVTAARDWLLGGNTIVRVGLVILFVGLSFLASYAAQAGLFPLELRLAAVAAAGIALLVVGFLRRQAKPDFALALQGTGVAVIYLTIFAAARLFELMPLFPALGLMLLVCALGCALALLQGSQALAFAAFAGGFAAPVLLGGEGSATGLFAYFAILNLAVLALVWRKGWRAIAVLTFIATFGVMAAWVGTSYQVADYAVAQAFLAVFVLVHLGNAILVAGPRPGLVDRGVQSTLLFGPALAGFGIQAALVEHLHMGAAFSALAFAAVYLGAALILRRRAPESARLLTDGFVAIAVGFVTLAVPLAFGARWTSAVWAIEGAAAFWVGQRQGRWLPRAFGLGLAGVAALNFGLWIGANESALPLVGPNTLGAALIAMAFLAIAWWLRTPAGEAESGIGRAYGAVEALLGKPAFLAGFGFWVLALALEIWRSLPMVDGVSAPALSPLWQMPLFLFAVLLSAGAALVAANRLDWPVARWPSLATLPLLGVAFLSRVAAGHHVLGWPDALAWPVALALHYLYLRRNDRAGTARWLQALLHTGGVWLLFLLAADALWFGIDRAALWSSDWAKVSGLAAATATLLLLSLWAGRANRAEAVSAYRWPLDPHARAYWWWAALPVALIVWLGALAAGVSASGDTAPLPYLPLLNPVDLSLALAIGALLLWRRCLQSSDPRPTIAEVLAGPAGLVAIGALGFIALNSVWLRIAHQYLGVGWSADALFGSSTVQTGLTILWALLAVGLMLFGHRRARRPLWFAGAGLLGVVVLKLLLVDMSSAEGWQRIVAFIGVGVLMLLVGYFVPLPPKTADESE